MLSFASKIALADNRPSGFDYMRLVLATAVIAQHTISVTLGHDAGDSVFMVPFRGAFGIVLPAFFALSGFLVAGSLERNKSLVSFLGMRAIRLLPALTVEVVLSALVLGPLLTVLPLGAYVQDPAFRSYFLNVLGDIHYVLPGVFEATPLPRLVNAQLWTIPWELKCYLVLALVAAAGITARKPLLLLMIAAVQVLAIWHVVQHHPPMGPRVVGWVMVFSFLAGLALYRFRDRVPFSLPLFLASVLLTEVLLNVPGGDYLAPVPVAYGTAFLGLINPKKLWIVRSGDYSYGLYLYGFPIQQAVASMAAVPHLPAANFLLAYPLAFGLAFLSWHLVEKRANRLKDQVKSFERICLRSGVLNWHSRRVFNPALSARPS